MSVERLASVIAAAVKKANSTVGMAERGVISGTSVITNHGAYTYDCACPVNLYDGKQVWIQVTESGTAVIIGD